MVTPTAGRFVDIISRGCVVGVVVIVKEWNCRIIIRITIGVLVELKMFGEIPMTKHLLNVQGSDVSLSRFVFVHWWMSEYFFGYRGYRGFFCWLMIGLIQCEYVVCCWCFKADNMDILCTPFDLYNCVCSRISMYWEPHRIWMHKCWQ